MTSHDQPDPKRHDKEISEINKRLTMVEKRLAVLTAQVNLIMHTKGAAS